MRKTIKPAFFTGILLISIFTGISQTYYFDNYGVNEGLDQSRVFCIIQDQNDYLWLGTQSGISRFDGLSFENFTSEDSIAKHGVRKVHIDTLGRIWFGHEKGSISLYENNEFRIIKPGDYTINGDITSITEDHLGQIWITSLSSGAFLIRNPYNPDEDFEVVQFRGKDLSDRVFGSLKTRKNELFFITDVGIREYNFDSARFIAFHEKNMPTYFQITTMMEDSHDNLWFGTYHGGLYFLNREENIFRDYLQRNGLADNWVSCLTEDRKGNIWVGTWGGGISKITSGEIHNFNQENGLDDNKIWAMYEDIEGNMLIGTHEHGLSIFKGEHFVIFNMENGLINQQVWSVYEDKKKHLWFGTNEGITRYNPGASGPDKFTHLSREHYSIHNQIRFIKGDRDNNIWLGTNGGGVFEYIPSNDRFIYYFNLNNQLLFKDLIVTAMEIDGDNNLWVGTNDGLVYYEIENRVGDRLSQIHGLAGNEISALYLDDENLWIGSKDKGLTKCDISTNTFKIIASTSRTTPITIIEDQNQKLWIGTHGQGIMVLEGDSIVLRLSQKEGLLANLINQLNVDEQNNIYIGTNKGLNVYKQDEDKIYTYTQKSGFVGIETKPNATYRDSEGYLWFGTVDGVIRFDPTKVRKDIIEPLTHISKLQVNWEYTDLEPNLKLNYKQNHISFEYYSICLTDPEAVRYQVFLEGSDNTWQPVTTQARAIYSSLSPGKYTFNVKAINNFGIWNKEPVSYSFTIAPPFYATWWFILICVFTGGALIFIYIKLRERKLIREKRILEETVKERTREVVEKNEELAMKNKDITDSIHYASRIQFAILPPELPFENTFIFFRPKDIVSGDFYWIVKENEKEFIAAVDCTGHGVPGAFMSFIGHTSLNKIVKEYKIHQPSLILDQLNQEVSNTLHQKDVVEDVKDGMDISLICYDTKLNKLEFAGAYRPLFAISDGELIETKPDRIAIGQANNMGFKYTNHIVDVKKGDMVYLFSDGYPDQFGGEKRKKYKTASLKRLLIEIHAKPVKEQETILGETHDQWKGDLEQIDDILVIGRRF